MAEPRKRKAAARTVEEAAPTEIAQPVLSEDRFYACESCHYPLLIRYALRIDGKARMVLVCDMPGCPKNRTTPDFEADRRLWMVIPPQPEMEAP